MKSRAILLATVGSLGDLYPFLALARELRARGHRPLLAAMPSYRAAVERAGIEFVPVRPDPAELGDPRWMSRATHSIKATEYIIRRMILAPLETSYRDLEPTVVEADFVVAHPVAYAAKLAAERHGVPFAVAALQPSIFFSVYDPPLLARPRGASALRFLGRPYHRILFALIRFVMRGWAGPLRRMRRELGLPRKAIDPLMVGQFPELLNLGLFSPLLAQPQPDWPPNTVVTGFPFGEPAGGLSPELEAFLEAGSPPVVFTLGSLAVLNAGRFFAESAAAARLLGLRAVLLAGNDPAARALRSGKELFVTGFEPHRLLFPRAAAIVHQGGIGTTAEALRAGRPALIVPFANDQPDTADRACRLGVARVLKRSAYRAARAAGELRKLLEEPRYRAAAAAVSERIAAERGAAVACDAIEDCLDGEGARPPGRSFPAGVE